MRTKIIPFLITMIILFGSTSLNQLVAQSVYSIAGKNLMELKSYEPSAIVIMENASNHFFDNLQLLQFSSLVKESINEYQLSPVPNIYSFDELGFFCKIEVLVEKKTKFPIKVRLGEVQYVERLEGKY